MKIIAYCFAIYVIIVMMACNRNTNPLSGITSFRDNLGAYSGDDLNKVEEVWKFETGAAIRATPLISGGQLYFGSGDSTFYSLNISTGKEIWRFRSAAAIHSSACILNSIVYFQDRMNNVYALKSNTGKILWETKLGASLLNEWGFDYYQSSPLISDSVLFIGSGDGNLYALDAATGKNKWTYNSKAVIRSSPAISNGAIYFGDCSGKLYSVDSKTGNLNWKFKTIGDTLKNEDYGFDRKAIIAKPAIKNNIVVVGSKDGNLYAVEANSGKELWKFNYDISWVITSVAIKDSVVIAGTSDGKFINALNLFTGKQIWQSPTGIVWASPIIIGNTIATLCNDGLIYLHDISTGKEIFRQHVADKFFSSPVYYNNVIYSGNDDGNLYALKTLDTKNPSATAVRKAVFWIKDPIYQSLKNGVDIYVKDYFASEGYEVLDEAKLVEFLNSRIEDTIPSVIVFATNLFPEKALKADSKNCLLRQYLEKDGKIIIIGPNPAIFNIDYSKKQFLGYDFSLSENATGLAYPFKDLRSHKGFYPAGVTDEGRKWGLTKTSMIGIGVNSKIVLPFALDETGNATYWVKNYGHKKGTGFVQLWLSSNNLSFIKEVKQVAEYGLN